MPPADYTPRTQSQRSELAAAQLYQSLTVYDRATIWSQVENLSPHDKTILDLCGADPVKVYCRNTVWNARNTFTPQWEQQLPCTQKTQMSTLVPQPAGFSQEYPIVIEEAATPAATAPQPVSSPKPKIVEVTHLMQPGSPNPEESDLVYYAFCTMIWMGRFADKFQFSREARSHRWFVREDDPKVFYCLRTNDGLKTPGWELHQQLTILENALKKSNEENMQAVEQRGSQRGKAAAENKARKEEEKMRKKEEKMREKGKKRAKRAEEKTTAPQRSKRKAFGCDADHAENSPQKKPRRETNEANPADSGTDLDAPFEEVEDTEFDDLFEEVGDTKTPLADAGEAMNDKASSALVEGMVVGAESPSADCEWESGNNGIETAMTDADNEQEAAELLVSCEELMEMEDSGEVEDESREEAGNCGYESDSTESEEE